jgi:hypothetical protein
MFFFVKVGTPRCGVRTSQRDVPTTTDGAARHPYQNYSYPNALMNGSSFFKCGSKNF